VRERYTRDSLLIARQTKRRRAMIDVGSQFEYLSFEPRSISVIFVRSALTKKDQDEESSEIRRHGLAGASNEFPHSPSGSHGGHAVAERLRAGQSLFRDRPQRTTP